MSLKRRQSLFDRSDPNLLRLVTIRNRPKKTRPSVSRLRRTDMAPVAMGRGLIARAVFLRLAASIRFAVSSHDSAMTPPLTGTVDRVRDGCP